MRAWNINEIGRKEVEKEEGSLGKGKRKKWKKQKERKRKKKGEENIHSFICL